MEMLEWHLQAHPDREHVRLHESADQPRAVIYGAIYLGARVWERILEKPGEPDLG